MLGFLRFFATALLLLSIAGCYQSKRPLMPHREKTTPFGAAFRASGTTLGNGIWRRIGQSYRNDDGATLSIDHVSGKTYLLQYGDKNGYYYVHAYKTGPDTFSLASGNASKLKSELHQLKTATDVMSANPLVWKQWYALKNSIYFSGPSAYFNSYGALEEIAIYKPAVTGGYFWTVDKMLGDGRVYIDRL